MIVNAKAASQACKHAPGLSRQFIVAAVASLSQCSYRHSVHPVVHECRISSVVRPQERHMKGTAETSTADWRPSPFRCVIKVTPCVAGQCNLQATDEGTPVVSGSVGGVLLDLCLAGGIEGGLLQILLQATDDLGVAVLHILAECLQEESGLRPSTGHRQSMSLLSRSAMLPGLSGCKGDGHLKE